MPQFSLQVIYLHIFKNWILIHVQDILLNNKIIQLFFMLICVFHMARK